METFDLIVVGMGVGGEEVTGRCAKAGMEVLAVERKLVGGECPYWGCIPSKVMVRAGNTLAEAARAVGLAGHVEVSPAWAPVAGRVREVTADWNDEIAVARHEKRGATVLKGEARIVGAREVEVDGERYRARRGVVIATGTEPAAPPVEGLGGSGYWTNREAIEADPLPESIVVLGAGPIGLELGQVFHRFGTEVTFVEIGDHALALEEPENGAAMDRVIRDAGMTLLTNVTARRVARDGRGLRIELSDGAEVRGERLLVATGRETDLWGLGAEAAGLDPRERWIAVDEHLRAGEGLWAVGDVTGKGLFTHVAVYQGRIAAADILDRPHAPADYSAVPRVTFTDPEVASVGLSEADARRQGISVGVGLEPTSSSARGWIHGPGAEQGVTKLIADLDRGCLVGASTMGPAAGEVIGLLGLAVRQRIPLDDLGQLIYPYPTFVRAVDSALSRIKAS